MERVETLIKKINELFAGGASPDQLLFAIRMLEAELQQIQTGNEGIYGDISVTVLSNNSGLNKNPEELTQTPVPEEKIVEILQVDEAEIEAELEEIKRNATALQKMSVQNKPTLVFEKENDPVVDENTKVHKELNETITTGAPSVNDKLKQAKIDLGDTLLEVPIRDLKKAIDINERFLFINELFRGDEAMYERSIKTINSFSILPEAEYWIQRELKIKIGWNEKSEIVQQFDQLVKRRFS